MVTTNSTTGEIKRLLSEALEKTQGLAEDLDKSDVEVRKATIEAFKLTITLVLPVIKYVDVEIAGGQERGVVLGAHSLTREGKIHYNWTGRSVSVDEFLDSLQGDGYFQLIEKLLEVLSKVFLEALEKMDKRRYTLQSRAGKLARISAVLGGKDSV